MPVALSDLARLREASAENDALTFIDPSRLISDPPRREWMVERAFPKGTVAMVSGDGGIGKSLLMQQLISAACLGRNWLGLRCRPGRGLMLACEDDDDELHRRQHDICRAMGVAVEDVLDAGLYLAGRVGKDNILARLDRQSWRMQNTQLSTKLLKYCLELGISYLVIDTATQTFAGNQNDEQQVVQFINLLRRLAVAIQGVVILTKHPSLTGRASGTGESGNTAWHNSVRSRLYVYDRNGFVELRGMKSNYGPKLDKIPLRWERGVFVVEQPAAAGHWSD